MSFHNLWGTQGGTGYAATIGGGTVGRVAFKRTVLVARLERAGCVSAEEEADDLLAAAGGDGEVLESFVARRLTGEPLAWIIGSTLFCDLGVRISPGVYVPRWQTETIARRGLERLPPRGTALEVCAGSGAIARVLMTERPGACVLASDIDPVAVSCAALNGVDLYLGDLFDPFPPSIEGQVDLVIGVVPYVPTPALAYLQRDTFTFESPRSYDGGTDGLDIVRRVVRDARRFLRPGGALILELGGNQPVLLMDDLAGYLDHVVLHDEEGDICGIEATLATT